MWWEIEAIAIVVSASLGFFLLCSALTCCIESWRRERSRAAPSFKPTGTPEESDSEARHFYATDGEQDSLGDP